MHNNKQHRPLVTLPEWMSDETAMSFLIVGSFFGYFGVGAFVAGVLKHSDVVLCLLFWPMVLLYELGLWLHSWGG